MKAFRDFQLRLTRGDDGNGRVTVIESPAGNGTSVTVLRDDQSRLAQLREQIRWVLRNPGTRAEEEVASQLETLGGAIFATAFPDRVRTLFDRSWGGVQAAPGQDEGLRLKLRFDPSDSALAWLEDFPWEALRVPGMSAGAFSPLDRRISIVRYLEVPQPPEPVELQPPLRVLLLASQPTDLAPLGIAAERTSIGTALDSMPNVVVETVKPSTLPRLQQVLRKFNPHVLHFMGHGLIDGDTGTGQIVLEDALGRPAPVDASALAELVRGVSSLRLVVLNACLTATHDTGGPKTLASVGGALVEAGVPAVVAMQFEISDGAAKAFAEELYTRMAEGGIIDDAVAEGRQAIRTRRPGSFEWCTPVLFMRSPGGVPLKPAAAARAPSGPQTQPAIGSYVGGTHTNVHASVINGPVIISVNSGSTDGGGRGPQS